VTSPSASLLLFRPSESPLIEGIYSASDSWQVPEVRTYRMNGFQYGRGRLAGSPTVSSGVRDLGQLGTAAKCSACTTSKS
jgi:hypothetical protein